MNKDLNSRIFSSEYAVDKQEKTRLDTMLKLVGTGKDVLDTGCRDGTISKMIENLGNYVEAIEISEFSIKKAREKGLKVYDLDLNAPDWADKIEKRYDVVFAAEILEHVFETDLFLQNIHKVLKTGGILVLSTPNLASLGRRILLLLGRNPVTELNTREGQAGHVRYYVYEPLKDILRDNGFEVIEFTSDVVNFNSSASLCSTKLAKLLPTIGRSLIVKAVKNE
jgi:2-polyprenyl-3-methyl-5-hydroxy-6-metoxy-1,4-benzoquinol methylase